MSHIVRHQKLDVKRRKENDNSSPYHAWREQHGLASGDSHLDHAQEPSMANPDVLPDVPENRLWGQGSSSQLAELLIERYADENGDFPILSKRQNEVLRLTLMGMSVTEVGIELKLDPRRVSTYLKRIQSRLKRLVKTL